MKLSRKTDYALRVLMTLVAHRGQGPIPIRELARRNDVPKPFLEQILLAMKAEGWVDSVPGKRGGYALARPPREITMGQVVRRFDGYLAPVACVSTTGYRWCSQESVCRFRRVLLEIRNRTIGILDAADLTTIHEGKPVTREEVFEPELTDGGGI